MNAISKTGNFENVTSANTVDTLSGTSLITMGAISFLVGAWAVACLVSAVLENGGVNVLRGLMTALIG